MLAFARLLYGRLVFFSKYDVTHNALLNIFQYALMRNFY